ncbi:TPA: hypothetical protein RQN91_005501 [Klebsiella michiganensis]|nr:hypothetical protein [Klebsiella michiganensis]
MPKIQSYVTSENFDKMQIIIDEMIKDGATRSEANISLLSAKLINMGLILWEAQNKSIDENHVDSEVPDFNELILKSSYRTEFYAQAILQLILEPSRNDKTLNLEKIQEMINKNAESQMAKLKDNN